MFSADQMMVFLPDVSKHTVLPRGMAVVHTNTSRNPARLSELILRNLYKHTEYYQQVCNSLSEGILPNDIFNRIMEGPATQCGNDCCAAPLFTESYFLLLKK